MPWGGPFSSRPVTLDFQDLRSDRSALKRSSSIIRAVSSFAATRTGFQLVGGAEGSQRESVESKLTILADISPFLIGVLELPQSFDDVHILSSPRNNPLGTLVEAVVENLQGFEDVTPVLSFIVQSLV